jgi:tRNA pseudouridine32 synthase/23S rRNA pseudouridine746 synthase
MKRPLYTSSLRRLGNVMTEIEVVYSDNSLIVVNKPSGLLSVPGRGPDKKDCVIARVQMEFPTARVVHRLDCATSGLMVLAQSLESQRELSRQFHDREVSKEYTACVAGHCPEQGEVNLPLMTDWPNRPRQMVSQDGKAAQTFYRRLERYELDGFEVSRVALTPVTGRSHQLRVHMMSVGHVIIGDNLYARDRALDIVDRLYLHASQLKISQPESGEVMEFVSDAPF